VAQLETPVAATVEVFRRARAAGATTIFNPAPADRVPAELLGLSDVLVVNAHEFRAIFGVPVGACLEEDNLPESPFHGSLICTLGGDGAAIHENTWTHIPGHPAVVADSTGAGDCFVGYLAAGVAGGDSLEQAARRANRAAAISVTRHGAISSIPFAAEVTTLSERAPSCD
jgi:ribokinase